VRRATGRLLGGWWRWATVDDAGSYWREDLATGARTRLGPVDVAIADDPHIESIARDAAREGRHDDAAQIRAGHPSTRVDPIALAIPGTRNVLLVTPREIRVL
jgi:hypothetical protein